MRLKVLLNLHLDTNPIIITLILPFIKKLIMNQILTFSPVFVHLIWGGERIAQFKGLPSQGNDVGESWELSPMPGHESVVDAGPFKGETLNELIAKYGDDIMGKRLMKKYDGKFPLLIKFIDSKRDLSIQVHPDDELSAKRHNKKGKTEMWYSIAPAEGAYLYAGFREKLDKESFRKHIEDSTIVETLNKYFTKPGDVFFLPAGCVHAIGQGNFVAEIQEASDVTYRIFDYNRLGADGKPRQLHIEESMEATKFDGADEKAPSHVDPAPGTEEDLVHCPFFNTDLYDVDGTTTLDLAKRDSFTILIAVSGDVTLHGADGNDVEVKQGTTVLVPASLPSLTITGKGRLVSVYVP